MVYKALNAEAPIYLAEQFTRVSDITSRTLRNSLLSEIKSSRTFGSFQRKLKAMYAKTN